MRYQDQPYGQMNHPSDPVAECEADGHIKFSHTELHSPGLLIKIPVSESE